jgi:hypothetical protein
MYKIGGLGHHYGGSGCGYSNVSIQFIDQIEVGNVDALARAERASEQEQVSSVCWQTVCKKVTRAPLSKALTNTWGTCNTFADCVPAETGQL